MSSTSSSDFENCDCCQCGPSLEDNYSYNYYAKPISSSKHVPFYSTMGHPLIYYAEVCQRPLNRRQKCDQSRKENQNCFVKAFKWYTQYTWKMFGLIMQERPNQKSDVTPERSGFANWLDNKYIEYLRESRQNQACYALRTQETAIIEPCEPCSPPYKEPCTTKQFARVRSPWRKRRRPYKDLGEPVITEKCNNQSCEFILQPKDLTRAASDYCYPAPTSGCIKSNATVASSNAPCNLKCSGRSHSLSSVCREKSVPKHIDTIPCTVQECPPPNIPPPPPAKPPCEPCNRREQIQQVPSKSRKVDVECQCPEEKVIPVNVETQYEPLVRTPCYCILEAGYTPMPVMPVQIHSKKISSPETKPCPCPSTQSYVPKKQKKLKRSTVSCQCPEENIVRVDTPCQCQPDPEPACECRNVSVPIREIQEVTPVFGPKPIRRQSICSNVAIINEDTCECLVKQVTTVSKFTRSLTCVVNDAVQTSDHSICFDRCGACPCPLFLKIVCADKLNNESF